MGYLEAELKENFIKILELNLRKSEYCLTAPYFEAYRKPFVLTANKQAI